MNLRLHAPDMSVDELEAMLPALGIAIPSGSQLQGGTLSAALGIAGPVDKLVIRGLVRLTNTKLAGFDLGSKLGALAALAGKAPPSRHDHPKCQLECARGARRHKGSRHQSDGSCLRRHHRGRHNQPRRRARFQNAG